MGFWGTMAVTVLWMPIVMYFCGYLLKHCADAEIWAPIVVLIQVAVMILTIPVVEKALKKRFG